MSKTTRTTIVGVTALAGLLLSGCAADIDIIPSVAPVVAATETPAAKATLTTGDIVDAATAAELKSAAEGQRGYPLDDGTFVVVNKLEPLPAVVQADIDTKAAAFLVPLRDITDDVQVSLTAPGQAAIPIAKNTGKRVIVAWQVHGFDGLSAEVESYFWIVAGGPDKMDHYYSQAEAQAAVEAWLATQDDAATYAVVYVG